MSAFKDLTGMRFGRLLVIKISGKNKHGSYLWECICENDNNIVIVSGSSLLGNNTKSCGCFNREASATRGKTLRNNIKDRGIAAFNSLYSSYKYGAAKRNYVFALTKEQFKILTSKQCYYCGKFPENIKKSVYFNGDCTYNGIDRVDNTKGYTLDNCVPCCILCNRAKHTNTQQDFIEWVIRCAGNLLAKGVINLEDLTELKIYSMLPEPV